MSSTIMSEAGMVTRYSVHLEKRERINKTLPVVKLDIVID